MSSTRSSPSPWPLMVQASMRLQLRRRRVCALSWALACVAPLATAQVDLSRCRAIADPGARLVCYDALPGPATATSATPAAPATVAAAGNAPAPAPATAALPRSPAAPGSASRPQADAERPAVQDPSTGAASFGLEPAVRAQAQEVVSRVSGLFEGWGARTRIRLANGQVWQVVDGSSAALALNEPRVTVRRALMGDFVLEVEGSNRTAKVKRLE